jgi:uncharacterized protein (DUF885 family)
MRVELLAGDRGSLGLPPNCNRVSGCGPLNYRLMRRALLLFTFLAAAPAFALTPETLKSTAHDYYQWYALNFPTQSSDQGLHTWDDRLTDYSPAAIAKRNDHLSAVLAQLKDTDIRTWSKDDKVDFILFRSQVDTADFYERVLLPESTNPQVYVDEVSNGIFSLLKKEYDTPARRVKAATARLQKVPALMTQARQNLTAPVGLYSQLAIDSARSIDSLFDTVDSLAGGLPAADKTSLGVAKRDASKALHDYADWLQARLPSMKPWQAMGTANYEYMLRRLLLLPMNAREVAHLGEVELARYRALEAMLPDPSMADPNPQRAADIPPDQQSFLLRYQSREESMIAFLKEKKLITIPEYLGPFLIRQLPEAFKPTSPGGFMNPPGLYDADSSGFYFIPTYDPKSHNFYIRAAIEDPRPILGHEGIPGHFLQLSIMNHLPNEIRKHQGDTVFTEGWALYTEEMLTREGLYPENSAAAAQVLRLSRYRSARIGVDVNLHTGKWSFEQAVQYFMEGGGLDKEAAEGEAAGAASSPTQKISYITGKWQIMRLLGKYRDEKGASFRLGQFHDDLIANGSLPLSVIEWLLLDDPSTLEEVVGMKLR